MFTVTAELEELIDTTVSIPTIPTTLMQINKIVASEDGSTRACGDVIIRDPAIATKLLRLVNSSFYSLKNPVSAVPLACSIVGMRVIKNLVLQATVLESFAVSKSVQGFDPETKTFTRFMSKTWPNSLRRGGPDSGNNIWFGVYGYVGKYGKLARIDAKTGELTEREIPIKYGQPYDAKPDEQDNVWISSMNYLTRFDPKREKFTVYPLPARTDMPKIEPTQAGSIWFAPRVAANNGYGGTASVLYPDKDAIRTLRAIPSTKLSNNLIARYRGPYTKVKGVLKLTKEGAQNEVSYPDKTVGAPVEGRKVTGVDPNETH